MPYPTFVSDDPNTSSHITSQYKSLRGNELLMTSPMKGWIEAIANYVLL